MEPASLALGIATVGGAFKNCLELYRFIQTAKALPDDLNRLVMFTIIENERFHDVLKRMELPKDGSAAPQGGVVTLLLGTIEDNLDKTTALLSKYAGKSKVGGTEGATGAEKSRSKLKPTQRLNWAISDKERLKELTNNLKTYNDGLVALAPSHIASRMDVNLLTKVLASGMQNVGEQKKLLRDPTYSNLARHLAIKEDYESLDNVVSFIFKTIGPILITSTGEKFAIAPNSV
jgi:hypothetical protein